ncbi:MAG TPA: choice-of-anchor D domain-containing protein, partial [Acidobacteriaceae bacterium]
LTINPTTLTFPSTAVGAASSPQTLTIVNAGQTPIADLVLTLLPPFAIQTTTCSASLVGGGSCTVSVLFSPTTSGSFTGSLAASSSAAQVSASANFTGTATLPPGLTLSPSTILQFPTTSVGQSAAPVTVTVANQGSSAALTGLSITLDSAAAAAGFGIASNTCLTSLAASASCTLQVTFTPTNYGALTGNLILTSVNGGSARLALAGFGFSFTLVAIGNPSVTVVQGQTAYYTLAVNPLGGASGAVTFACGTLPAKALCIFNPGQLTGLRATGNVQLGISTGAPAKALLHSAPPGGYIPALAALFFLPALFLRRRLRRLSAIFSILLITLLVTALTGLFGCAGSGGTPGGSTGEGTNTGGTPTGTYPVTVTAASGGLTRTAQLTLIVN